jgi:hypothetical protein
MKTRLLIIIGIITFSFVIPQSFASCIKNEDWSDAPCMDNFPINRVEFQLDWAPYYEYKGSELMESKYVEMQQAINNGTFNEWNDDRENFNVYYYYLSTGKIQNQYPDRFIFDDEVGKYAVFPPYFVIILASVFVILIIVIVITYVLRRKRK